MWMDWNVSSSFRTPHIAQGTTELFEGDIVPENDTTHTNVRATRSWT